MRDKVEFHLQKGKLLTRTEAEHVVCDSCKAIRQKAVKEASESVPSTSPYRYM